MVQEVGFLETAVSTFATMQICVDPGIRATAKSGMFVHTT